MGEKGRGEEGRVGEGVAEREWRTEEGMEGGFLGEIQIYV